MRKISIARWTICAPPGKIETALYARYLRQHPQPPRRFLYDITNSYLEGEQNELGEFGYNRGGKKGGNCKSSWAC